MTGLALLLAFLIVPIVEIYVIIQVGHAIGAVATVILLLGVSIVGAAIVRREGARAWRALTVAIGAGRMPTREVADGALLVLGGALLLVPGFVTDAIGLLLVLPLTRPLARRLVAASVRRRVRLRVWRRGAAAGTVIDGEVVDGDGTPAAVRKRPDQIGRAERDEPGR